MAGGEGGQGAAQRARLLQPAGKEGENELALAPPALPLAYEAVGAGEGDDGGDYEIGRASCRERV